MFFNKKQTSFTRVFLVPKFTKNTCQKHVQCTFSTGVLCPAFKKPRIHVCYTFLWYINKNLFINKNANMFYMCFFWCQNAQIHVSKRMYITRLVQVFLCTTF